MYARPIHSMAHPMAYADQKRRKVFVLLEDRSFLIPPDDLQLEDKDGNKVMVPIDIKGGMTVLDVAMLAAGGYWLRVRGVTNKLIRIILF